MSELKKTRDASTYQKLPPPKSLLGEEDAEVTWDIILKRYPNAAPLLCEMENVIERAEGLLHQLRSPYTHALERSSSFQIADSQDDLTAQCDVEKSTEISIPSEQCSYSDSAISKIIPEAKAGDSISQQGLENCAQTEEEEASTSGASSSSNNESNSINPPDPDWETKSSLRSSISSGASFARSQKSRQGIPESVSGQVTPRSSKVPRVDRSLNGSAAEVEKTSSLEAWGKVVGETTVTKIMGKSSSTSGSKERSPPAGNTTNAKEDTISEHARRLSSLKSGPMQQITKLNILGKRDELMHRFAGTIATASKVVDTTRMVEETQRMRDAAPHVEATSKDQKERDDLSADRTASVNEIKKKGEVVGESLHKEQGKVEGEVQGNGDDGVAAPRSAIEILDEYSKVCGLPVEYKNLNPSYSKSKNAKVKCCFAGFSFDACSDSRKSAKNSAAAMTLNALASRQIDGESIGELAPFSRKQIEEILSLNTRSGHETPIMRLYKICMQLDAPEPVYHSLQESSNVVGSRYTIKCDALGYSKSGMGIRVSGAKKLAADQVLRSYLEQQSR